MGAALDTPIATPSAADRVFAIDGLCASLLLAAPDWQTFRALALCTKRLYKISTYKGANENAQTVLRQARRRLLVEQPILTTYPSGVRHYSANETLQCELVHYDRVGGIEAYLEFKDGRAHGVAKSYVDGKLASVAHYVDGEFDGVFQQYNVEHGGMLHTTSTYKQGKMTGQKIQYADDGKAIKEITHYADGFKHGPNIKFGARGVPLTIDNYDMNELSGLSLGRPGGVTNWLGGVCTFAKGMRVGPYINWNKDGSFSCLRNFVDDREVATGPSSIAVASLMLRALVVLLYWTQPAGWLRAFSCWLGAVISLLMRYLTGPRPSSL